MVTAKKPEITDYTLRKSMSIEFKCDGKYLDGGLTNILKFTKRTGGWVLSIRNAEFLLSSNSLKEYINITMKQLDAHKIQYSVTAWDKNSYACWFMVLGENGNRSRAI